MLDDTSPLTPNQIARRYGVGVHKVLSWIARGELHAINVASDASKRPQWCILPDALADFERRRAAQPAQAPSRRQRRKKTDVIEFF